MGVRVVLLSVVQARSQAMRRASGVRRKCLSAPVSVNPHIQEPLAPMAAQKVGQPPAPLTQKKLGAPPTAGVYMHSATNPGVLNTRAMEDFTREVRRSASS